MLTNRTPRSIMRRASRQARANDGLVGSHAVQLERRLAFAAQVHQLRSGGLQPKGHLVGGDARGDFRIADGSQAGGD